MKRILLTLALGLLAVSCSSNNSSNGGYSSNTSNQHNSGCSGYQSDTSDTSDTGITTRVKSAIMSDTSISGSTRFVSVSTTNGVVTLTGTVSSSQDMHRVVHIANGVQGVKRVDNQLTISNS